jgi:hypothetical protein
VQYQQPTRAEGEALMRSFNPCMGALPVRRHLDAQ